MGHVWALVEDVQEREKVGGLKWLRGLGKGTWSLAVLWCIYALRT